MGAEYLYVRARSRYKHIIKKQDLKLYLSKSAYELIDLLKQRSSLYEKLLDYYGVYVNDASDLVSFVAKNAYVSEIRFFRDSAVKTGDELSRAIMEFFDAQNVVKNISLMLSGIFAGKSFDDIKYALFAVSDKELEYYESIYSLEGIVEILSKYVGNTNISSYLDAKDLGALVLMMELNVLKKANDLLKYDLPKYADKYLYFYALAFGLRVYFSNLDAEDVFGAKKGVLFRFAKEVSKEPLKAIKQYSKTLHAYFPFLVGVESIDELYDYEKHAMNLLIKEAKRFFKMNINESYALIGYVLLKYAEQYNINLVAKYARYGVDEKDVFNMMIDV